MLRLPNDLDEAAIEIARTIRRIGLREISRRTGIPLTTISRRTRDIAGTRMSMLWKLLEACRPEGNQKRIEWPLFHATP